MIPTRMRRLLPAVLLAAAVAAVYAPVAGFDFMALDDPMYVSQNRVVLDGLTPSGVVWAFTTGENSNWHPLTWLTHMADATVYGLWAGGHHLTNVLLHAAASILLFVLLHRMTGAEGRSLFVAAAFAVHPAHVESVAWISERKDVLSAVFWFLTTIAWVRWTEAPSPRRSAAAVGCYALGLMAKPMLVTLPFTLLLLDYWPLRRTGDEPGRRLTALLREKAPLFLLAGASSVITFFVQRGGGAVTTLEALPFGRRLANAIVSWAGYLWKLVWPVDLTLFYPMPEAIPLWKIAGSLALLAGLTAIAWRARSRQPWLAVGWLWYLGTLVPVIGLVHVGEQALADRYTYIPFVGLFIAIAWGAAETARSLSLPRAVPAVAGGLVIVALLPLAFGQAGTWRNSETMFVRALAINPDDWLAHRMLGALRAISGAHEEAMQHFEAVIRLRPGAYDAHDALGATLLALGQTEAAKKHFDAALAIKSDDPDGHFNTANVLAAEGRTDEARRHYELALQFRDPFVQCRINYGLLLARLGRLDEAREQYGAALRADPGSADASYNMGNLEQRRGRYEEAIRWYERALLLRPDFAEAQSNYGAALAALGRSEEAIVHYVEAVRLNPENARAHNNLGSAQAALGRMDQALSHYREALRVQPDYVEARVNMGNALLALGRREEAAEEYREALRLHPDLAQARRNLELATSGGGASAPRPEP